MDQMPVSTLSHGDIITPTHCTAAAPDAGTRWKNESTARTLKPLQMPPGLLGQQISIGLTKIHPFISIQHNTNKN